MNILNGQTPLQYLTNITTNKHPTPNTKQNTIRDILNATSHLHDLPPLTDGLTDEQREGIALVYVYGGMFHMAGLDDPFHEAIRFVVVDSIDRQNR